MPRLTGNVSEENEVHYEWSRYLGILGKVIGVACLANKNREAGNKQDKHRLPAQPTAPVFLSLGRRADGNLAYAASRPQD
jgi:hypothetical protein